MPIINTSQDIGFLDVQVILDISGTVPVINLINQTTPNENVSPIPVLDGLVWVLNVYSPTGTPIYTSDFDNPFKTGIWTTAQLTNAWPQPFGQIEWSEYSLQFQVKDTDGTIYPLNKVGNICRPVGNTKKSINPYGQVDLGVQVMCQRASLYIVDNTSKTYQGITGTNISSYLAIDYPRDATGVRPDPFEITSFVSDALVPFTFNGANYEATYYTTYQYDLGDNVFVIIRYVAQRTFPVQCNIDLCAIACELKSLEVSIDKGTCLDAVEAQQKINKITPKLLRAFIAQQNPTCGEDLEALTNEIIAIGDFQCDCSGSSSGIGSSAIVDGLLFNVVSEGGDIAGHFTATGGNVVLYISDKSYTFGVSPDSQTDSITLVSKTSGTNVNTLLSVNINDLATDLYNATASNITLINLFNSLINQSTGNFQLTVDGGCIFSTGQVYDYDFTLHNIPASGTFALLTSITKGATPTPIVFSFNQTNLAALQAYLNELTLGLGTFVVTNLGSGNIQVSSTSNTNILSNLTYKVGATNYIADLTTVATGYVPLSANDVVQRIIYAFCNLDDTQVKTSQDYTVTYINPTTQALSTITVNAGSELNTLLVELLDRTADTDNYILSINPLNCATIQAQFPQTAQVMQSNDFILGTKNGSCARISPTELFSTMLQLAAFDPASFGDFCSLVNLCRGGHPCTPFSIFNLSVIDHSPTDNQQNLIVTFANTDPLFTGSFIAYARVDNTTTPIYTTLGSTPPGVSPLTIPNLPEGQYIVSMIPEFSDGRSCPAVFMTTAPCTGVNAFNAVNDGSGNIDVTYSVSSPKLLVNVIYPNGGSFSQIYNNGDDVSIPLPANVYGNFTVTIQPVCNETTGFFGSPSAPAIVSVPQPSGAVIASMDNLFNTGSYIAGISGIPAFSLTGNLNKNTSQSGIHTDMSGGAIVSFSYIFGGGANHADGVNIYVNSSLQSTVTFGTSPYTGIYQATITAATTDTILLQFTNFT